MIKWKKKLKNINARGIFTHFAASDEKDKTSAEAQFNKFKKFLDELEAEGITFETRKKISFFMEFINKILYYIYIIDIDKYQLLKYLNT